MRTLTAKEAHAVFGGAIGDPRPGVFETGDIFVLETVTIYGDPSGGAESLRDFGTFLTIATGGAGILEGRFAVPPVASVVLGSMAAVASGAGQFNSIAGIGQQGTQHGIWASIGHPAP